MFWYSKLGVNILSVFITLILFSITFLYETNTENWGEKIGNQISFFHQVAKNKPVKIIMSGEKSQTNILKSSPIKNENIAQESVMPQLEEKGTIEEWSIEIPSINLMAPIKEGTTSKIMEQAIGHFEETGSINGNVGLAAHNRGYSKNYFENIKHLKIGDKIFYKRLGENKIYEVIQTLIIKEDDWTYLENTEDNRLTLITCVENQPEYRRCVQAKEMKKEGELDEK